MAQNTEDFNPDELHAPQWLNAEFFSKVLRKSQNNNEIEVSNVKLTPGTGKGDHYASIMFRTVVDYHERQQGERKTKSMIIKTMPEQECVKKELLNESHLFETEIGMYTEIIPKFEEILRSAGDATVLGGRCLYHTLSPRELIIFEDICPLGYTVVRDRSLTLAEAKVCYMKLAKWHAISYKLNLEQPHYFDKYRHNLFGLTNMVDSDMWTGGITMFIEMFDRQPCLAQYKRHFEAYRSNLLKKCIASFEEYRRNPQEDAYYVLAHGDFHAKNMMFKHSPATGQLEDVMLLDFQLAYVGSIALDLLYSFALLLSAEQRANNIDELIYYYFNIFSETLEKVGFEGRRPKLVELRAQLMRHKHFEIFLMTTFLPALYCVQEGNPDFDEMMASVDYRKTFYDNPKYIAEMQQMLPKMLHLGYFDN